MDRPVALGGAGGVVSSLLFSLLRQVYLDLDTQVPIHLPLNCPIECPEFAWDDINWWVFLAGLGVGLTAGPLIDLLYILRQRWRRWIWRLAARDQETTSRALHKVLA